MAKTHGSEGQGMSDNASDVFARKAFYATLAGCLMFALAVFAFVL